MKKRFTSAALAAVLLVGLSGFPASGSGKTPGDHVNPPVPPTPKPPKATCTVSGSKMVTPGVSETPAHNSFEVTLIVQCPAAATEQNLVGTYVLFAEGTTDGPDHLAWVDNAAAPHLGDVDSGGSKGAGKNDPDHGEDCIHAWGVNATVELTRIIPGAPPKKATGKFHFVRTKKIVDAWGFLVWDDGKKTDQFYLDLVMVPVDPTHQARCTVFVPGKIPFFSLSGMMRLFN